MTNRAYGIRLNPRQAWAWERLGNEQIRQLLAPEGVCVQCGVRKAKPGTRNAWFCFPCQDQLGQQSLLPEIHFQTLVKQNQSLLTEVKRLRVQLEEPSKPDSDQQIPLFPVDS